LAFEALDEEVATLGPVACGVFNLQFVRQKQG
jgi:hypothetical protein